MLNRSWWRRHQRTQDFACSVKSPNIVSVVFPNDKKTQQVIVLRLTRKATPRPELTAQDQFIQDIRQCETRDEAKIDHKVDTMLPKAISTQLFIVLSLLSQQTYARKITVKNNCDFKVW